MTLRTWSSRCSRPFRGWRLGESTCETEPCNPQGTTMGKLLSRGKKSHSTRLHRLHRGWMTVEDRMEKCLGEINRKMFLSRIPLMTRRVHPELIWYQKKNTSKLQKGLLDSTRRSRARSIFTKLVMTRKCEMRRTLDTIPSSCSVSLLAKRTTLKWTLCLKKHVMGKRTPSRTMMSSRMLSWLKIQQGSLLWRKMSLTKLMTSLCSLLTMGKMTWDLCRSSLLKRYWPGHLKNSKSFSKCS